MTGNLHLSQVVADQNNKETTINDADAQLELFLTAAFSKDLTGLTSPYALTTGSPDFEAYRSYVYTLTGTLTGTFVINVPVDKRPYKFVNATSGGHVVTVKTVSGTGIDVPAGLNAALYCDGTNVVADPGIPSSADVALLDVRNTFTKAQAGPAGDLTDASTVAWGGDVQLARVTLGGNRALAAISSPVVGTYILIAKQDATGGRTLDLTAYKHPGGTPPILSTAANAVDALTVVYDGTNLLCIGLAAAFA